MNAEQREADAVSRTPRSGQQSMQARIEIDEAYQHARQFANAYRAKTGVDYSWVYEYAKSEYERVAEAVRTIESKADSIAQYIGGLSGVLAIAGGFATGRNWWLALLTIPSFVLTVVAFRACLGARKPEDTPSPPPGRYALEFADTAKTADEAKAKAAAKFFEAAAAMRVVARVRGSRLDTAGRFIVWALCLLVLPLLSAALRRLLGQ